MPKQILSVLEVSEDEIGNNPLRVFDACIIEGRANDLDQSEKKELKEIVLRCILSISDWGAQDADVGEVALDALDHHRELNQKQTVAACFLRLLPERAMDWVLQKPWRPQVAELLDSQFAHNLYAAAKVDRGLMSHEKLAQLAKVVEDQERQLNEALQTLTSLARMSNQRKRLMRAINSKFGRSIVYPFLLDDIKAQLSELYRQVETYLAERNGLGVIAAQECLYQTIKQFESKLVAKGTLYSLWIAEQVIENLRALVEEDFADNRAVQPANVSVEARDKKYPFHLVGEVVNLGFIAKNQGPGYAYNVKMSLNSSGEGIDLSNSELRIGRLAPYDERLMEINSEIHKEQKNVLISILLEWDNFDETQQIRLHEMQLEAQKRDINWSELIRSGPYSLEPVIAENDLVGRADLLNRLIGTARGASVGSSIISGQKRVGKTSIARSLLSYLRDLKDPNYLVVYLDDYIEETAEDTIKCLTREVCQELNNLDSRIANIGNVQRRTDLSSLADFLKLVTAAIGDDRIVIILDEFDEIPLDLYARGALGRAFFLKLRSLSSNPQIGFVLVGGEKMAHIIECQGSRLNKWDTIEVDYFSRGSEWADYQELIQHPVDGALTYTNTALETLYDLTAGNPYFTKLICISILDLAQKRRDCYITDLEIEQAARIALRKTAGKNDFQHFWDDGIFVTGEEERTKSIERRKVLIALSDVLEKQSPAPKERLAEHSVVSNLVTLGDHLKEFSRRKILEGDIVKDTYDFKVPFFQEWLAEHGVYDLIAGFRDLDMALRKRQEKERIKIKASEIVTLVEKWPLYQDQSITEDRIRAWLEQFGDVRKQRAMFSILQGLHFYSNKYVREKMMEVHEIVKQGLTRHLVAGKVKRSDILVSYLDSPAKSGAHYARLYQDVANIYVKNVISKEAILERLQEEENIQALVFVDDFVGTGQSAIGYLSELDTQLGEVVKNKNVKVVFVAIVGYVEGWERVQKVAEKLSMNVEVHACEMLDATDQCFSDKSDILSDPEEKESAKEIALSWGRRLESRCPLGYGDLELALVFERRCPNNSLPILWSESGDPEWIPLFKRN